MVSDFICRTCPTVDGKEYYYLVGIERLHKVSTVLCLSPVLLKTEDKYIPETTGNKSYYRKKIISAVLKIQFNYVMFKLVKYDVIDLRKKFEKNLCGFR